MAGHCFNAKSKQKAFSLLWLLGGLVLAVVAGAIYFPNYSRLKQLRSENEKLLLKNNELRAEIAGYEEKLKRVGKDPYLYEKIARDELGVAKESEIVIDIGE